MTKAPGIYAVSTMFNGNEMIRQLIARGVPVKGVIGLAGQVPAEGISGYESPEALCHAHGLEFIPMQSYNLMDAADKARLADTNIDVALILGWQRLVPQWFLERCSRGAIGVHGSADGITGGRGRSPQNWALILGKKEFHLSIFFADPGIDAGPVIDSQAIPLSPWDDIRSSHLKVGRATVEMLVRNFANGNILARKAVPQQGTVRYLPQRKPEDGALDWRRGTIEIDRFIRGLSRPYPGAFSAYDGGTLRIWKARPFPETLGLKPQTPGTVIDRFIEGELLIQTGDGLLFVEDYSFAENSAPLAAGTVLRSVDYAEQIAGIVARHYARYPDLPLIEALDAKEKAA